MAAESNSSALKKIAAAADGCYRLKNGPGLETPGDPRLGETSCCCRMECGLLLLRLCSKRIASYCERRFLKSPLDSLVGGCFGWSCFCSLYYYF